jgi:hypothetical protein
MSASPVLIRSDGTVTPEDQRAQLLADLEASIREGTWVAALLDALIRARRAKPPQ